MWAMLIFAQAAEANPISGEMPTGIMVVLIVAAVMAVPITAIVTGVKYATKERELQHAERIKALEHGVPLDDIEEERRFRKGIMRLAGGIGVAVPICAVGAATGAVIGMGGDATSMVVFLIWTAAGSVGVAGVASGAWLAQGAIHRLGPQTRRAGTATSPYPRPYESPQATATAR
jgi:hypothetical protein